MSEGSSFVTEYIYCEECFNRIKPILSQTDEYLTGKVIEPYPIISGKVGSRWTGLEGLTISEAFEDKNVFPCHLVKLIIVSDGGEVSLLLISPDGWVETVAQIDCKEIVKKWA